MKFRHLSLTLTFLAGILTNGCTTWETVSNKLDEITEPELPREIYAHTTTFGPQHFAPWKAPNPFDYEGKYDGESGDTAEYLDIEIFGQSEGVMITGSRRVETAGLAPVTTPIAPTRFELEFDPVFQASRETGFFVEFTDPSGELFDEPTHGIVLGTLFFAKEEPPPSENYEDDR